MVRLSLQVLGGFRAELHGQPVSAFESNKVRALLAYLAVESDRSHQRSALAGLLWPDHPEEAARTNLRHVLRQLRSTLDDRAGASPLIIADQQTITLDGGAEVRVDAAWLRALLAECARCDHRTLELCADCMARYEQAEALYRGPFLAGLDVRDSDLFAEWAALQRERLHRQALEICFTLASSYEGAADYGRAQRYARRQLELEPWREEAHRQLMRVLARCGQRTAALAHYAQCRTVLAAELGVEPDLETSALYEAIRSGELGPAPEAQAAPARRAPATDGPLSAGGGPGMAAAVAPPAPVAPLRDWGEAPTPPSFYGRQAELATLEQWLVAERRRLVVVLSMGGMGKTSLVARSARDLAEQFEVVLWRSLRNAPLPAELLRDCLLLLLRRQPQRPPDSFAEQLVLLLDCLRQHRCLLVLDNLEAVLEEGRAGRYRPGYEAYGELLARAAQSEHRSCIIITSRERPQGVLALEEDTGQVRVLPLRGLEPAAGQSLLKTRGLDDTGHLAAAVVQRYSGNPLALKLVARTIQELFDGDIAAFLSDETLIFNDIRTVLEQQLARLSPRERETLLWLAVEREAVSIETLDADFVRAPGRRELVETLLALQRRSLLEKSAIGFTLQNVVMEYATDLIVERACSEIEAGRVELLDSHALLKAQAKQYVRQSQRRLLLQPVAQRLSGSLGLAWLTGQLRWLLDQLQARDAGAPGYAAGNLLNLLVQLGAGLRGFNFARLSVWQADLRETALPEVDFTGADLRGCAFSGTFGLIYAVAYHPDGELLAVGTGDGTVHLWSTADYQPAGVCQGHRNGVQHVAFSPDGRLLVSAGRDQAVCVWESATGRLLHRLMGHSEWVWSVAFSPDGRTVASCGADRTIRLWDLRTGDLAAVLAGHAGWVLSVAFSPDGATLASGSADGTIRLWEVASGTTRTLIDVQAGEIAAVAFSPDGAAVAGCGGDHSVRVWDTQSGRLRAALHGHSGAARAVAFGSEPHTLVSGGRDHTLRVWDLRSGEARFTLLGHSNEIRAIAVSGRGDVLASGSGDQTVRLWDLHSGQALQTLKGHLNAFWSVAFAAQSAGDRGRLASGGDDQRVRIWDLATGQVERTLEGHVGDVCAVAFSPDGRLLASGGVDQAVRLWEIAERQAHHTLDGHANTIWSMAFSPDGRLLASGGADLSVRLWDVDTRQVLHILRGHSDEVRSVAFSPDGRLLASGGADLSIRLWDVASATVVRTLSGHTHWVREVAFSPDGRLLASCGADRTVRLWDLASGAPLQRFDGHEEIVGSVAFSPDGRLLASGSTDRSVRLWDVRSGQAHRVLTGHTMWVRQVAFSPDGLLLASASVDETIKLWDVATGACLRTLRADGPYAGMKIAAATSITAAQRAALKVLGAIE